MAFDWDQWNQEWLKRYCPALQEEIADVQVIVEPVEEKPAPKRRSKAK